MTNVELGGFRGHAAHDDMQVVRYARLDLPRWERSLGSRA